MNLISNTSMVDRYQEVANQEYTSFGNWSKFSVICMIALCIFAVVNFFFLPLSPMLNWGDIGRRLFVAITIATVAGYASRQARVHLDAATNYRKMELELTSLNPYLLELGDEKRKQILADMVVKFSGKDDPAAAQPNREPGYTKFS